LQNKILNPSDFDCCELATYSLLKYQKMAILIPFLELLQQDNTSIAEGRSDIIRDVSIT